LTSIGSATETCWPARGASLGLAGMLENVGLHDQVPAWECVAKYAAVPGEGCASSYGGWFHCGKSAPVTFMGPHEDGRPVRARRPGARRRDPGMAGRQL